MNLLPNIPPKIFTLSACAVGFILLDDLTANEQNAAGNWLMLVAQVLCTNAFYKQVLEERNIENKNNNFTNDNNGTIKMMEKMIFALQKEINEIKKSSN